MSALPNDLPDQEYIDPHVLHVGQPLTPGHRTTNTHTSRAGGESSQPAPMSAATPSVGPAQADALLLIYSDILDDLERTRIANANRLKAFTTETMQGEKGGTFGKGVPADSREAASISALVGVLEALEHGAELELKRALRRHPLGAWVKRTIGVGEKQGARLLAAIGDPARFPDGSPRRVGQLTAYCGLDVLNPGHRNRDTQLARAGVHSTDQASADTQPMFVGGVARRRAKGQKANWNATAKMRAILVAESCIKAGVRVLPDADDADGYDSARRTAITPHGRIYLDGRAKYAKAVHNHPCAQCGPSGKPAQPGSPLSDGHKHARALRLVAKEILKDLWKEAQ